MRAPRSVSLLTALALFGLGAAGCATQVRAHGVIDPAATISPSGSPTPVPTTETPTPVPTPTLDTASERRITCLLVTPSVSKAITDWNNYVDKKGGTKATVAASLTGSAGLIDTVLKSSRLTAADPVRGYSIRLSQEMKTMAATLRRGAVPAVDRFNDYKRKLQASCPKS
jgi:hypothetical protein